MTAALAEVRECTVLLRGLPSSTGVAIKAEANPCVRAAIAHGKIRYEA
jgi:hypothetical protein